MSNDNLQDIQEEFSKKYKKIENYIKNKEALIQKYKHVPIEEILSNAPKYYALISFMEKINVFITKDHKWLKHFVDKNHVRFDYDAYDRWKANKKFHDNELKYSNTQSPAKWIHSLQDYFLEILEYLQILLLMEYYLKDEDFKTFLKNNPEIAFKLRVNFVKSSLPSQDIEKIFYIIDYLLNFNIEHNFLTNLVINTSLCMKVYREIDKIKIFDLLKEKEFYIRYRLLFLKKTANSSREKIPYEEDVIEIAEKFLIAYNDLKFAHKEYKSRLMEKFNSSFKK